MTFIALAAVLASTVSIAGTSSTPSTDINLAAFANGALVESVSSNYGGGWEGRWLTDGNPQTGWATEKGANGPFTIVISLPERSEFRAVEFDVAGTESPERSVKDIDVLVSDTSAIANFTPVVSVTLKPGEDRQRFAITKPGAGRWLKFVMKSNHGDPDYTELMEFRAFGRQLTQTPMPTDLSGTYISSTYGAFHLQQTGAALSGCYEHNSGLVDGGAESNLMRLTWHESGPSSGPAIMVLKRDGKSFEGWWASEGSNSWSANWDLKKTSNVVGSCPNWNPRGASGNIVATELAESGHARLYGINFDTDSDHLRPDAKPAIDQLLGALKAHPDWKISIDGHTDSTGNPAHNLDLSKRRAASVMAALAADGIEAGRMTSQGFGQTKPIASNDNEIGRAQNRRVEVVRP